MLIFFTFEKVKAQKMLHVQTVKRHKNFNALCANCKKSAKMCCVGTVHVKMCKNALHVNCEIFSKM